MWGKTEEDGKGEPGRGEAQTFHRLFWSSGTGQREEAPCGTLSRDWLPGSLRLCLLPSAAPALAQRPSLSCPVTCQSRG